MIKKRSVAIRLSDKTKRKAAAITGRALGSDTKRELIAIAAMMPT